MCRTCDLHVRVTVKQDQALAHAAEALHTTKSELVRALISSPFHVQENMLNKKRNTELVVLSDAGLRDTARQIRAWGYHYDQALHALNKIAASRFMKPDVAERHIVQAQETLDKIDDTRHGLEMMLAEVLALVQDTPHIFIRELKKKKDVVSTS